MNNQQILQSAFIKSAIAARASSLARLGQRFAPMGSRVAKSFGGRAFTSGLRNAAGLQANYLSTPFEAISRRGLSRFKGQGAQKFFRGMQNMGDRMFLYGDRQKHLARNIMGPDRFRGGAKNPMNWGKRIAGDWVNQSLFYAPFYGMGAGAAYKGITGNELNYEAPEWYNRAANAYFLPSAISSPLNAGLLAASHLAGRIPEYEPEDDQYQQIY